MNICRWWFYGTLCICLRFGLWRSSLKAWYISHMHKCVQARCLGVLSTTCSSNDSGWELTFPICPSLLVQTSTSASSRLSSQGIGNDRQKTFVVFLIFCRTLSQQAMPFWDTWQGGSWASREIREESQRLPSLWIVFHTSRLLLDLSKNKYVQPWWEKKTTKNLTSNRNGANGY